MKICPYCGKELVEQALACKYCGEWLEDISNYLEKKGSVYAHTDSVVLPLNNFSKDTDKSKPEKKVLCVFCENPADLDEKEKEKKIFICNNCGKKNFITDGHIDDILKNIPIGWGWILLTGYFVVAIQKYLNSLDDRLQIVITFSLSVIILLSIYFLIRRYILKERYEKKNFFGKINDASLISGVISTVGVVLFIFSLHIVYPFTGLQSDKKETQLKVRYYNSKINGISEKQKEITMEVSKPIYNKKDALGNIKLLDDYISLNNEEKKYTDSIYKSLEESNFFSGMKENKKKIKEANLLISKIIAFKIMSAQNLKSFYLSGDKKAFESVEEINSEIANLNKEYSSKYKNILIEE
jgi:hypothetical protein